MNGSRSNVLDRLADDPRFLAGWLRGERELIARRMGIDEDGLWRLLLCKAPTPSRFADDVLAIADYVEVDAIGLAGALREAAVYSAFKSQPAHKVGVLAAARDREAETFRWRASSRVRRAVEGFWTGVPTALRSTRMLERIAPLALPVAIVTLPKLRVSRAQRWLADRGVELRLPAADRPLRGLLLSWRGLSLLIVDGALDPDERRVTVAHELGHVVLDYLDQRVRVLREAPGLLGVIDGYRPLTAHERIHAVLDGVPLGLQAHLLTREPSGATSGAVDAAEQEASTFALELLAPEREVVARLRPSLRPELTFEAALAQAADMIRVEFELPPAEARARARGAVAAIGRQRGFFER